MIGHRVASCLIAAALSAVSPLSAAASEAVAPSPVPVATSAAERAMLVHAADLALQGNRLVEAQTLLDRLAANPGDDRDLVDLMHAELLVATGRGAEALAILDTLDDRSGDGCRIRAAKGMASMQSGDLPGADAVLLGGAADCERDPVMLRARGRLHLARERPAAAADAFARALELRPDDDAIRNDLAVALIASGDAARAIPVLTALTRREPQATEARINLDYANGMLGQMPARRDADDDLSWSRRLQYAGYGAWAAGRKALAEALLGQALVERPRHDAQLWRQYSEVSQKK